MKGDYVQAGASKGARGREHGEMLSRRMASSSLCTRKRLLAASQRTQATERRQPGNVRGAEGCKTPAAEELETGRGLGKISEQRLNRELSVRAGRMRKEPEMTPR